MYIEQENNLVSGRVENKGCNRSLENSFRIELNKELLFASLTAQRHLIFSQSGVN